MNKSKLLTIAVIGLLLLNLGTLGVMLFHKPPRPPFEQGPPRDGEGPKMLIIERLHFDEAQQKKYDLLIEDHKTKNRELQDQIKKLNTDLYSLLKNDSINDLQKDSIILKIADSHKAMNNLNFDHFKNIKTLCKPDQINDFNELAEELAKLFAPKGPPRP